MVRAPPALTAALVAVAMVAALPAPAAAFHCACFKNLADSSYLGVMCTSMYVPSSIVGWGHPVNTWFSIDCSSCSVDYNCTRAETVESAPTLTVDGVDKDVAMKKAGVELPSPDDDWVHNDPVPCCAYGKKENYYAEGIHCDALNPNSGKTTCDGQEYGAQLMGQWYVSSLFNNQCYFVVGQTGEVLQ